MDKNKIEQKVLHPSHSEVQSLRKNLKVKPCNIDKQIKLWLEESECPFSTAVVVLRKSLNKKSLSNYMCENVAKNLRPYNIEKNTASKELKLKITQTILKFNKRNRKRLVKAFSFNELDIWSVKTTTRKFLKKNDSKSFFINNKIFKIHGAKLTRYLLLTSISKGNSSFLLKYAKCSVHTKIKLMKTADKLIGDHCLNTTTVEHCESLKNLADFMFKSKKRNPISYSIAKAENYKAVRTIPKENAKVRRILTHINCLIQQWEKKQISGSSLENLIFRCVGNNCDLLEKVACLVEKIFKDKKRADLLRQSLQPGTKRTPIWSDEEEIPISDHELKLVVPLKNVNFVDTEEKLKKCEKYFKKIEPPSGKKLPVGFNSEWVTDPVKRGKEDLAIIQLAVNNRVYLIDFVYFQQHNMKIVIEFVQYVFRSRSFMILAFGLGDKKKALSEYFRKKVLLRWETNSIDFLKFRNAELYSKTYEELFKFCPQNENQLTGLSGLCYQVKIICCRFELAYVNILTDL